MRGREQMRKQLKKYANYINITGESVWYFPFQNELLVGYITEHGHYMLTDKLGESDTLLWFVAENDLHIEYIGQL